MYCDTSQGCRLECEWMMCDLDDRATPERLELVAEKLLESGWKDYKTIGLVRHGGRVPGAAKEG